MVFCPLNAMCTHSGNPLGPAPFQYPPAPTLAPVRSPSFTALAGYPALAVLEADATPPLACAATFTGCCGSGAPSMRYTWAWYAVNVSENELPLATTLRFSALTVTLPSPVLHVNVGVTD